MTTGLEISPTYPLMRSRYFELYKGDLMHPIGLPCLYHGALFPETETVFWPLADDIKRVEVKTGHKFHNQSKHGIPHERLRYLM
jgi:hypothetical protein